MPANPAQGEFIAARASGVEGPAVRREREWLPNVRRVA
jgi:hypothetical protein